MPTSYVDGNTRRQMETDGVGGYVPAAVLQPSNPYLTFTTQGLGTTNGADLSAVSANACVVVVDITAITGTTPTFTVTIQGKDAASGKYYTILTSTGLNTAATTVLRVCPGLIVAANLTVNDLLPSTFRVIAVIGGTSPAVTATIGVMTSR